MNAPMNMAANAPSMNAPMNSSGPQVTEGFCGSSMITSMLLVAFLFFVLTPGVLVRFPTGYGKYAPAIVHGILFAALLRYVMGVY